MDKEVDQPFLYNNAKKNNSGNGIKSGSAKINSKKKSEYSTSVPDFWGFFPSRHQSIIVRKCQRVVPGVWIGQPHHHFMWDRFAKSQPQLRTSSSCTAMAGSQSSSYTGRFRVPNLSKNEWKDLDRELKPILAPWHEHLAIATSQNISEKLCHSHLCTLS